MNLCQTIDREHLISRGKCFALEFIRTVVTVIVVMPLLLGEAINDTFPAPNTCKRFLK